MGSLAPAPTPAQQIGTLAGLDRDLDLNEAAFADRLAPLLQNLVSEAVKTQPEDILAFFHDYFVQNREGSSSSAVAPPKLDIGLAGAGAHVSSKHRTLQYTGHYAVLMRFIENQKAAGHAGGAEYERLLQAIEAMGEKDCTVSLDQSLFADHEEAGDVLGGYGMKTPTTQPTRSPRLSLSGGKQEADEPPGESIPESTPELPVCTRIVEAEATAMLSELSFELRRKRMAGVGRCVEIQTIRHAFASPFDLISRYNIDGDAFAAWVGDIAQMYLDNPYHNWSHAMDVFHFIYSVLTTGKVGRFFNFQDVLGLLVAALGHDVGHLGVSNAFLVMSQHSLALRYNDHSPLENMHAATTFETYFKRGRGFLNSMKRGDFDTFRAKVVECILATDMSHHFELIEKLQSRLAEADEGNPFTLDTKDDRSRQQKSKKDRRLMMQAFTHMADLGPNCQPWSVHKRLVAALEEEFFNQGDQEAALGIPIMPMMNRSKDSAAKSQNFFLGRMVRPLLDPCNHLIDPEYASRLVKNLENNTGQWVALCEKYPGKTAQDVVALSDTEEGAGADAAEPG
mmetsp:Transcript_28454/g.66272  ORF Transcript_28454/g.66272 Transcript_28454/m.66272 type:complete len:566 (-) Transcript_28454:39-1736(-)